MSERFYGTAVPEPSGYGAPSYYGPFFPRWYCTDIASTVVVRPVVQTRPALGDESWCDEAGCPVSECRECQGGEFMRSTADISSSSDVAAYSLPFVRNHRTR